MSNYVGQQFGDYRLTQYLGDGGFADVYLGEHFYLENKRAAVKVLKGEFTAEAIEEFRKEAQTIVRLQHPHIVQLITFSETKINGKRTPFLVMDYAPCGSLDKRHPRGAKLSLATILSYVKPIAEALQYAHDQKVIHRDIKPANFLLTRDGKVLLSDFGIAVVAHGTDSWEEQKLSGSWPYAAPEHFDKKAVLASDQYSLGIVVYRWLCGECPFSGDFVQLGYQHHLVPPPPLHEKIAISDALEGVILRALAKDPQQRFASVLDFVLTLEATYMEEVITSLNTSERAAESLLQEYVQQALLDLIMRNPSWWKTFAKPRITALWKESMGNRALASALALFAKRIIPVAVSALGEDIPILGNISKSEVNLFLTLLDVMLCTAPPEQNTDVWITLLHAILASKKVFAVKALHWDARAYLLSAWGEVLSPTPENNQLIRPLLSVSWSEFGEFLSLRLHKEWNSFAAAFLTDSPVGLTPSMAQNMAQKYALQTEGLFRELLSDTHTWPTAKSLFTILVASGYTQKTLLLSIFLDSPMDMKDIQEVLNVAHLTDGEAAAFFEHHNQRYLSSPQQFQVIMDVFAKLVMRGYPGKMERLCILLDSSQGKENVQAVLKTARLTAEETIKILERYGKQFLQSYQRAPHLSTAVLKLFADLTMSNHPGKMRLFFMLFYSQVGGENLEQLLGLARLTTEEGVAFFQRYGSDQRYLPFCYQSPATLALFAKLAKDNHSVKTEVLSAWFESSMSLADLERVLEISLLSTDERFLFLERFGQRYLQCYPRSPVLLSYLRNYLQDFSIADGRQPSLTPAFFRFLSNFCEQLPQDIQSTVKSWHDITSFVAQPTTNKVKLATLASALSSLAQDTRAKLIEKLAQVLITCVEDEIDLIGIIYALSPVLAVPGTLQLLYKIAESIRDAARTQYSEIVFVHYIHFALDLERVCNISRAEQERFAQTFLDTLLGNTDSSAFGRLNTLVIAQNWPRRVSAQWHDYVSKHNLKNEMDDKVLVQDVLPPLPKNKTPVEEDGNAGGNAPVGDNVVIAPIPQKQPVPKLPFSAKLRVGIFWSLFVLLFSIVDVCYIALISRRASEWIFWVTLLLFSGAVGVLAGGKRNNWWKPGLVVFGVNALGYGITVLFSATVGKTCLPLWIVAICPLQSVHLSGFLFISGVGIVGGVIGGIMRPLSNLLPALLRTALLVLVLLSTVIGVFVYGSFVTPYPAYLPGHGSPALYDPLQNSGSSYGWKEHIYYDYGSEGNEYDCNFIGGAYNVNVLKGYHSPCYAQSTDFSDFAFEVDMKIIKGDCGGIIFRADSMTHKYYFFDVCRGGAFVLFKYVDVGNATQLISDNSAAIKTGLNQFNQLVIVAKGNTLILYVNSQKIGSIQDGSYNEGQIALVADGYTASAEVAFENAKTWIL